MGIRRSVPLLIAACSLLLFIAAPAQATARGGRIVVRALAAGGPHPLAVADARVTVVAHGRVVGRGRTGSQGIAFVHARPAGGPLLVRVGGGRVAHRPFAGRMEAVLAHYTWPETAHVNSLTTLAARFSTAAHVGAKKAARRVRRFLHLPAGFLLGLDGRTNFAFDGRRFLRAEKGGDYDALVARLVRRMRVRGAHRSFPPPRHRGAVDDGRRLLIGHGSEGAAEIGEAISNGSGFFEALERTDYVLDFADAVIDITGIGGDSATAAELEEVSSQLQQVEEGVATVRAEVDELRKELDNSTYGIKAEKSVAFHAAIATAEASLQSALAAAAEGGCTRRPVGDAEKCEEAEALLDSVVEKYGKEGPTSAGRLESYADYIGGDAEPEGAGLGEGLIQAASRLTTNGRNQVFYTAQDSQRLVAFADYWDASFAEALVLAPLVGRLEGEAHEVLAKEAEEVAPYAKALLAATPRQLAAGTTIDMVQGTMWPTESAAAGTGEPWSWFVANAPWRYVNSYAEGTVWKSVSSGAVVPAIGGPPQASIDHEDWLVAGTGHLDPMLEAVETGPGQTPGEAVLEQSGISREIVIPPYGGYDGEGLENPVPPGRGLEIEYQHAGNLYTVEEGLHINSGCYQEQSSCYWPVWVGDDATIGNFNRPSPTYGYVDSTFEIHKPFDIAWDGEPLWGYDNEGTVYGNDPIANIPVLFFRQVGAGECYYYPSTAGQSPGSPGCPAG